MRRSHRGMSATVEWALLVPVLVAMAGIVVAGHRAWNAADDVQQAAAAASRAASLAGTESEARQRAVEVAGVATSCSPSVRVDTSAWPAAVGTPGRVGVHVECRVAWSDLFLPGAPGGILVGGDSEHIVDRYREHPQ